jgi:uncharacterized protein with HEPN domain
MSERDPNLLLTDMLDAVNTIFEFTESMSFEEFVDDRKTRDASLGICKF